MQGDGGDAGWHDSPNGERYQMQIYLKDDSGRDIKETEKEYVDGADHGLRAGMGP